jgi:tetratricopeptide (TPR) repeat protein
MGLDATPGGDARPSPVRRWGLAALAAVLLASGATLAYLSWPALPPTTNAGPVDEDDDLEPPRRDPGFVGPQACASCHAERVAGFLKTPHYLACREPDPKAMPAGFAPGKGGYATRDPSLRFEMTRDGDAFFQASLKQTPAGAQKVSTRIGLVYGFGNADEVYHAWHGEELVELPMTWLHPQQRWGVSPFSAYTAGEYSRPTTTRCLECHNTWFDHVAGTPNRYRREGAVLGVTCERCHGPGREHVGYHQANPSDEEAHGIVNPSQLDRDRQLDLCGQCHSNATKPRAPAFSYRPGEPLEKYFRVADSKYPEADHVANQVKYLKLSKCFQKSDMTCTTCHDPHRHTSAVEVGRSCAQCHQPKDCKEQERLPAGVRADCVGCHMPQHTKVNVYFHTEDDQYIPPLQRFEHRIAVHPMAREEVLRAWYRKQPGEASRRQADRLTEELVKHWHAEADKYRRQYRYLAVIGALREAARLDAGPGSRQKLREAIAVQWKLDRDLDAAIHLTGEKRFPEAMRLFQELLRVKPDLAVAHGKLGAIHAARGEKGLAQEHLDAVARDDPDNPYGYAMLGWLAFLEGRPEEAIAHYRRADEIEPYDAKTQYHWGLALLKLGRLPEARERLRHAREIDPKHAGASQSLCALEQKLGHLAEAVRHGRRAARLTKYENADVLQTLTEAYFAAERYADAETTARQALELASASSPDMAQHLRGLLETIRERAAGKRD